MIEGLASELESYVGFGEGDTQTLVAVAPVVRPHFAEIVHQLLGAIQKHEDAAAILREGAPQVEKLRAMLMDWLEGVFGGVYDAAYFERRARIGHVHLSKGVPQRYVLSSMTIVRLGLHHALREGVADAELQARAHEAVNRILDMELAVMLEVFREAQVQRIQQVERLATLGQVAGSIAHDIRNPLAVIETSAHLLRRRLAEVPSATKHVERIGQQVAHASRIVRGVLDLLRDREPERAPVSVSELLQDVLGHTQDDRDVTVALEVPPDLPAAVLDSGELRRVLINLVTNAREALGDGGGRIVVGAESQGDTLVLRVDDDGPGLCPEARERLFEPLFTTKPHGLGLGLASCKRIIERHGGTLTADNRPDGGARFQITLPGTVKGTP